MKRTTKYQLGYFEEGDQTDGIIEMQRWETLDAQLYAVFQVLGNGIISGWQLLPSSGLSIYVTLGSGHVNFVSVSSQSNVLLGNLIPTARNYIYATITTSSYWDQGVVFVSLLSSTNYDGYVYLGYVDTNATTITGVNMDGRTNLGFIDLITSLISEHRHIGGTGNPPPVNLASEVQGTLNQNSLPDLDASIIQSGTLDSARLPQIDHITQLINQGTLTHAQLDSFVEALSITNATLMGETSTIDLLQLILALKHIYPDIDQYLVNEIAYIPGISPDTYVDWDNTTATVDIRPSMDGGEHTITGTPAPSKRVYTYTWDNETEFNTGTYQDVIINGDQVSLATQQNALTIDEFTDLTQWAVITTDLSSTSIALTQDNSTYVDPPNSAKLTVGSQTVEIALVVKKEFDAMDWSSYGKLIFYLKTESVQHGDVYFYLNDAIAGDQNSYIKVLDRNSPTINIDTLENGWQEITIDISSYTRTNINTIGFTISSQNGWDTSKGFNFNLDDIYLTTGVTYKDSGYIREIFGSDFLYDFWRVRWDAIIPTDTQSSGVVLKVRTRVGNTLADLNQSIWSAYTFVSGSDIELPAPGLYKYIEIETYFESSNDSTRTAILRRLYLDFYAADVDGSFVYDTKDAWDSGNNFNIDTSTIANSISISKIDEINNIFYGSQGKAVQLDENLNQLYNITGSLLPRSTYQVMNGIEPSLGLITGIARGDNGNVWLSDIDNDRILELDKSGALVTGYYGSFLTPPIDLYGIEDAGPGSNLVTNVASSVTSTDTTTTLALGASLSVLQSIYNSDTGVLYVVFSSDLENIYSSSTKLNINRIYLKIGAQQFYLNDSQIELLGVDEQKYNDWYALYTASNVSSNSFIQQFSFKSHVLKITLLGADKTLLNYMVDQKMPSLIISTPNEQQIVTSSTTVNFLVYNFVLGSEVGQNGIQITLDSGVPEIIYDTKKTYTGLSNGKHSIVAQLINADLTLNTNIEAIASGDFIVSNTAYSLPYIEILTPKINQIYSASPVVIDFKAYNFPILATGQHLRYKIDSSAPVDYYTTDPISISNLSAGSHIAILWLVDKKGDDLGYLYGTVSVNFIVGLNSNAIVKLYIDSQAIYDSTNGLTTNAQRINTDVGNISIENIYSPIDIQMIPCETSVVDPSGLPSVLISKLRSPSWTNGLANTAASLEYAARIAQGISNTSSSVTSSVFNGIPTAELIYGTKYLDGHSVVQLGADTGDVLFSNNAPIFALTKEDAKVLLGSAEKIGDGELVIADSYNKRAIITSTNLTTQIPKIIWQYESDRYLPDAHMVLQDNVTISIGNDAISESSTIIRQGANVIWINNSSAPVTVYSGTTTYDQFNLDPDLNLYGSVFKSQILDIGERFTYKFVDTGNFDWFCYPSILTGRITVTQNRISNRDNYLILENDGLSSAFSSRLIKVDSWGNVLWALESYLVQPRDVRPLLNGNAIIST